MDKPHFSEVYSKANEILVSTSVINSFPYSVKDLVKEQIDVRFKTFAKARQHGLDMEAFGSESAIVMKYHGKTVIFYDETKPETHNRFSILHEAGHVINNHDFDVVNRERYDRYEIETNYFASQLLMPEQLLRYMQTRGVAITVPFLMENFGVSKTAAQKRIDNLAKTNAEWRSRKEKEFDDIILERYRPLIEHLCPHCNYAYDFEDEYDNQRRRDGWFSYR